MSVAGALARFARNGGQAAVEVLGLVPLIGAVALAAYCAVAAHAAGEQAGAAAEAGAVAILQDRDPRAAARAALPVGVRRRASVDVHVGAVRVRVSPRLPLPGASAVLAGEATASAGIRSAGRRPVATTGSAP